jgi:hypothetical protein
MSRLVERVMRGMHRLFLVSEKIKRHSSSFLVQLNGAFCGYSADIFVADSSGRQA